MIKIINNLNLLDTSLQVELTIAGLTIGILIIAIICLTIIKKLKDK